METHLQEKFGFSQFRENQKEIIKEILAGKNTMVIMPTGGGKSLCYQLPTTLLQGTALVISPLIALMKDQVDTLNRRGIPAAFLNSSQRVSEQEETLTSLKEGKIKLLYIAPETFNKEENLPLLKSANPPLIAIDEAHCITQWGNDFRPEYQKLRTTIDQLGKMPIVALTATATPETTKEICSHLGIQDATTFRSSFNRQNLTYTIRKKKNAAEETLNFIRGNPDQSGIIYCTTRKTTEAISHGLRNRDIEAEPYHAGLPAKQRAATQENFLSGQTKIIVATIAFGMGIDKKDIRFIIHYNLPHSIENFYQETGRAGRDGKEATCITYYNREDVAMLRFINSKKGASHRAIANTLLDKMIDLIASKNCTNRKVLAYFGEVSQEDCQRCTNCKRKARQLQQITA